MDFNLLYTPKGLFFMYLSVQLLSSSAQEVPEEERVSRNESGLLKQTYWKKICQGGC